MPMRAMPRSCHGREETPINGNRKTDNGNSQCLRLVEGWDSLRRGVNVIGNVWNPFEVRRISAGEREAFAGVEA